MPVTSIVTDKSGPRWYLQRRLVENGMRGFTIGAVSFALTSATIAVCTLLAAPSTALTRVSPGVWQLQEVDGPGRRRICATDTSRLLRLRESGTGCSRYVQDSDSRSMTASYTCRGGSWGRSVLTVHDAASIKLETQGIADGAPFAVNYDGKLIGSCTAQ